MLFTPYENSKSQKKIRMNISKEDMAKFDKLPSSTNKKTVTVKNLKNGKKYVVSRLLQDVICRRSCKNLKPRRKTPKAPAKNTLEIRKISLEPIFCLRVVVSLRVL